MRFWGLVKGAYANIAVTGAASCIGVETVRLCSDHAEAFAGT